MERRAARAFGIPRALLPEVLPCTAEFGTTAVAHFGGAIRIAGVAGDQQAALVGQAGFAPGLAKNTYGTGSFVVLNTGDRVVRSEHGLLSTVAFAFEPGRATYALEGSIFVTGAAVQWLRDGLGIIERSSDVERLAREVDDSGDCFFVPAFTGLGRAVLGPARARHDRRHHARDDARAPRARRARRDGVSDRRRRRGDGARRRHSSRGAARRRRRVGERAWRCSSRPTCSGVPVVRPACIETTALGAAYLAGLQTGFWSDVDTVARQWREDARFAPRMDASRRERAAGPVAARGRAQPGLGARLNRAAGLARLADWAVTTPRILGVDSGERGDPPPCPP